MKTSILNMAKMEQKALEPWELMPHLPFFHRNRQQLFGYFKQLFAQVTNPPIDAIREEVVTSTTVYIGEDGNLLEEKAENCKMLKVNNPILTDTDLLKIKNMKNRRFPGYRDSDHLL